MGGISIFIGRGSLAQVYFVVAVESFFLMHHMRYYPYVVDKHNTIDALGHVILILTYTVTFILRQPDDDLEAEMFPREGYGFFIVFLYLVVLPAPTIIYLVRDRKNASSSEDDDDNPIFFDNPTSLDGDGKDFDLLTAGTDSGPSNLATESEPAQKNNAGSKARLSKILREGKELRTQNEAQGVKLLAMEAELKSKDAEIVALQTEGASAANAEAAAAAASVAKADAEAAVVAADAELHRWDTRRPSQVLAMQDLAGTGVLSDAAVTKAKEHLELHLTVAVDTQRQQAEQQQWQNEVATMKREDEVAALRKRRLAPEQGQTTVAAARKSLAKWLEQNRLSRHELKFLEVVGPESAPQDLVLLSEEDMAELTAAMTNVEARRFEAARRSSDISAE